MGNGSSAVRLRSGTRGGASTAGEVSSGGPCRLILAVVIAEIVVVVDLAGTGGSVPLEPPQPDQKAVA